MPAAAAPVAQAAAVSDEPAAVSINHLQPCLDVLIDNKQEKPKEKTIFNVKLESFDAGAKPKVIREVKAMVPNLSLIEVKFTLLLSIAIFILQRSDTLLIQAKKFVESLPKILKENLSKADAEKLQKTFEAIGAVVKLE